MYIFKIDIILVIRCKHCPLKGASVPTINEADYGDDEEDDDDMVQ